MLISLDPFVSMQIPHFPKLEYTMPYAPRAPDSAASRVGARVNASSVVAARIAAIGDVNAADATGMRPLLRAAVRGDIETLRALLAAGARVDLPHTKSGAQAIHMAASGGSAEAIRRLVAAGASLEAIWPMNGHTPLVEATFKNNSEAALALLDAGADPAKTSIRGVGTMDFAMRNPTLNHSVVRRLDLMFAKRPDAVERKDAQGTRVIVDGRPVHDISSSVKADAATRIFAAVAARDAQIRPTPRQDQVFLDLLAAADRGDLEAIKGAIDADAKVVNQRGGKLGTTLLILAAVAGRDDVVRLLLDRGADPNLTEIHPMGVHALFKAAIFGHAAIAQMLVDAGAHVNDQGLANGMTPLHDAVLQGRSAVVRVLLRATARADLEDYTGATAQQFARERGSEAVKAVFNEFFSRTTER
ncbi:MAG: ankyrin repeat domain-containing protein [Clostridia bacterium]|nr:ankyrin repeat domain-containing protein [Deltaproteobacteria bacterium]